MSSFEHALPSHSNLEETIAKTIASAQKRREEFLQTDPKFLHKSEYLPGTYIIRDKLFPISPDNEIELRRHLAKESYEESPFGDEDRIKKDVYFASENLVQEGIACRSCDYFFPERDQPDDGECCPNCNAILFEKLRPGQLGYVKLTEEGKKGNAFLTCQRIAEDGTLQDTTLSFNTNEYDSHSHYDPPYFNFVIERVDKQKGVVYCYADFSQLNETQIEALGKEQLFYRAEKSYRILADKLHGKKIVISFDDFMVMYPHNNYKTAKRYTEKVYGEFDKLPIPESLHIYHPWKWKPGYANSHETWAHIVNMTADIGYYSTDHPYRVSQEQIDDICTFVRLFSDIPVEKVRAALPEGQTWPEALKAIARISGEPVIHEPNMAGAVVEGLDYRSKGQTPPPEQLLQEQIFFQQETGKPQNLDDVLRDLQTNRY